jgi:hypothetical protein
MAKIVVRKAAGRCSSSDEFLDQLAQEVPADKQKEFLKGFDHESRQM